ncbi:Protease II [Enhygromyxa salina]|uniref:Protease II n=1 Tax=Enhygromyxa salina TaxID=215803 RepID=A0A0C2CLY1_9BACT|nr:S9 family peptidase [Enhygromyxa salina]KIG12216.1 Protease II [Enhygromyxa salina]
MVSEPPVPSRRPTSRELFGKLLADDYAWMRDRDDPEVRAHLEAERAHAEAVLDMRTGDLRARLYRELRGRIKEDERSVPTKDGPWLYYSRTEQGDEYPRHCRRPHARDEASEQVYLNENLLAEAHDYFDLAALAISPSHRLCAYIVDLDGDEIYTLRIKNLATEELLEDTLVGCGRALGWGNDDVLFYTRLDPAHRPWQVWRHQIGSDQANDVCVHEERDPKFFVSVYRTRSDAFVAMSIDSQVTSEMWLIPTATPTAPAQLVAARREGVEYGLAHRGDQLFVLSNDGARNFAIELRALPGHEGETRVLVQHRDDVLLEDMDVFAGHLVIWERHDGLQRVRVVPLDPMPARAGDDSALAPGEHLIEFPDPAYSVWGDSNPEFETTTLRFGYTSLTTPASIYDYDLRTRDRTLRKREEVVGGHDPAHYRSARIWTQASDGARVPISLVWRAQSQSQPQSTDASRSPRPTVLEGYGAYGLTMDPSFSSARLSLLDRGVIWAMAHVRGGGELGRSWYDTGKLAAKHNSFDDFVACAEHLIHERWTTPAQLVATGGSAGGLLVGAVANARPELFTAIVADVPFVDVLNTMLDPSLPLSLVERDEWGDPTSAEGFAWIHAYAPYENVRAQAYPAMFVLAGWNDPRVGYWESAKWVARLRDRKTDDHQILLWTNMDAGHAGPSGRFEYLHELALEYAFLIDHLGLPNAADPRVA